MPDLQDNQTERANLAPEIRTNSTADENGGNAAEVTGEANPTDAETGEAETGQEQKHETEQERQPATKKPTRKKNNAKLLNFPVPAAGHTLKEEKFLTALLTNGFHKEKAAIAAGYSPKSAGPMASHLLRKDKIKQRLRRALEARVTIEELIGYLVEMVQTHSTDLTDDEGNIDWGFLREHDLGFMVKNPKTGEMYNRLDAIRTLKDLWQLSLDYQKHRDATDANRQFIARKVAELAEAEGISEPQALDMLKSLKPDWVDLQRFELPPIEAEIVEEDDGAE